MTSFKVGDRVRVTTDYSFPEDHGVIGTLFKIDRDGWLEYEEGGPLDYKKGSPLCYPLHRLERVPKEKTDKELADECRAARSQAHQVKVELEARGFKWDGFRGRFVKTVTTTEEI